MITDEDAKAADGWVICQTSHSSPGANQDLAPVSQVPGLLPDHRTFPCSIKTRHLKVVLGDQDLKKTESHEQSFGVEKIFKYSHYNERDEIPHNDIGKSLISWTAHGSCPGWISLLMES